MTLPNKNTGRAAPAPLIKMVPIASIKPQRHPRQVDEKAVAELAESIKAIGLLNPVILDQNGQLVAGRRRMLAHELLQRTEIAAISHALADDEAELATIDENLRRGELTEAERLIGLARAKELYEQLHPETRHGGDRQSKLPNSATCFAEQTAEATGAAATTVRHDIAIGEKLDEQAIEILDGHPAAESKSELAALASLPAAKQRKVAKAVRKGKARSVRAAVKKSAPGGGGKQTKDPRTFARLRDKLGALGRDVTALHKVYPHASHHRTIISLLNQCIEGMDQWRKAVK